MIQFQVNYEFRSPAERDGFYGEIAARGIGELCRMEPGCKQYDYFRPCGQDHVLFLLETWESAEAQQVHTQQPHFQELGKLKEKYGAATEILRFELTEL